MNKVLFVFVLLVGWSAAGVCRSEREREERERGLYSLVSIGTTLIGNRYPTFGYLAYVHPPRYHALPQRDSERERRGESEREREGEREKARERARAALDTPLSVPETQTPPVHKRAPMRDPPLPFYSEGASRIYN